MLHRYLGPGIAAAIVVLSAPVGAASAAGLGQACGGRAGTACDAGLWCDPRPGACGGAEASSECVHAGAVCAMVYQPVCGCDGKTYGNDCQRMAAMAAKAHDGACN